MKTLKKIMLGVVFFVGININLNAQEFTIVSITNPIETKMKMETFTVGNVFGKKIKADKPVLYKRSSKTKYYIKIGTTKNLDKAAKEQINKCANEAVAAGVLTGLGTGDLAIGVKAMKLYMKTCLSPKLYKMVSVKSGNRKTNGKWKKA